MSLETDARDGDTIQRFLDDPVVVGIFARIDQAMFAKFKEVKTNDDLRQCWSVCQGAEALQLELRKIVSSGERARHDLAEQQKKIERERNHVSRFTK